MSTYFKYGLIICGTIGGLYGGTNGFIHWYEWLINYKPVIFASKNIQQFAPIVNTSLCAGKLINDVAYYSISSAIVSITFPISVPALLYFCKKR